MRIGIYAGTFQNATVGGGHAFEMNFIESLKKLETEQEIYFFYFAQKRVFEDTDHVKFVHINPCKKFDLKHKLLKFLLYWYDIQVMYYYTSLYHSVDLPQVVTVWDLNHNDIPAFPEVSRRGEFARREKHYNDCLPRATRILVGNNTGKNEICTYYPIDERKIRTIPMFTPQDIFHLEPDERILEKYGLEKNRFIYYPAQFWAHKNHIRIVKALKELKNRGINLTCVFSGVGTRMKFIKRKVSEFGLDSQVKFVGFITREEVCALYKNALALTYASAYGPDNIPPLEALYFECPAIVSNIRGHLEQLGDNVTFFDVFDHIDLANKIEDVMKNGISDEKKQKGKNIAIERSSDNYVKQAIDVVSELEPIVDCWEYNDAFKPVKLFLKDKFFSK